MKSFNKLANTTAFIILLSFFSYVIFKNIRYVPKSKEINNENQIVNCFENQANSLKSLECFGEDILNLPIDDYKQKLNYFN